MTNLEWIRKMAAEPLEHAGELINFLCCVRFCQCGEKCAVFDPDGWPDCNDCITKWLNKEA